MRSSAQKNMPVVLKHTPNAPVMYISDVSKAVADPESKKVSGLVKTKWVGNDGTPYECEFDTEILEKFDPKKE